MALTPEGRWGGAGVGSLLIVAYLVCTVQVVILRSSPPRRAVKARRSALQEPASWGCGALTAYTGEWSPPQGPWPVCTGALTRRPPSLPPDSEGGRTGLL